MPRELFSIARRVGEIIGDRNVLYHGHDPLYERFKFKHKKTGKEASLTGEQLKRFSVEEDVEEAKKHLIDLFG